jgi:hypothetical protein
LNLLMGPRNPASRVPQTNFGDLPPPPFGPHSLLALTQLHAQSLGEGLSSDDSYSSDSMSSHANPYQPSTSENDDDDEDGSM